MRIKKKRRRRRKQRGGMHHGDHLKYKPQEALHYGIKEHWEMGVQQALQNGADVNKSSPYKSGGKMGHRTPLIAAVQEEAPPGIFNQILGDQVGREPTIDLDFKDTISGKTALEMAKEMGPHSNKAALLIKSRMSSDEMQPSSLKMNHFGDGDFHHAGAPYGHDHEHSKLLPAGPFKELKTGGRRTKRRRRISGRKTRRKRGGGKKGWQRITEVGRDAAAARQKKKTAKRKHDRFKQSRPPPTRFELACATPLPEDPPECHNCGRRGHWASQCTKAWRGADPHPTKQRWLALENDRRMQREVPHWICPVCRFRNKPNHEFCNACGTGNPFSWTSHSTDCVGEGCHAHSGHASRDPDCGICLARLLHPVNCACNRCATMGPTFGPHPPFILGGGVLTERLPCRHTYHKECIDALRASAAPNRCPNCRADFRGGRRKKRRRTRKRGKGKKKLEVSTKKPPLDPKPFMNPQEPSDSKDTFFDKWPAGKKPLTESESAALAVFAGIDNGQKGGQKKRRRTRKK